MALAGLAQAAGCGVVTSPTPVNPPDSEGLDGSSGGGSSSGAGFITDDGSATSCHASDVLTYVPGTYRPATPPSAACLGADGGQTWDEFFEACLGPNKSKDACTAYKATAANAACAACILTPYAADRLGPILDYGEFVGENVAGCIELTVPGDPSSCANAVQALTDCEVAACQANCPVSDTTSLTARQQCSADADATGCRSFAQAASGCQAALADAGVASVCSNAAFQDFYDAVVPLFCARRGRCRRGPRCGFGRCGPDRRRRTRRRRGFRRGRRHSLTRAAMVLEALHDSDPDVGLLRVLRDDGSADPATDPLLPEATVRQAYREMKRLRLLDARMISLQRQGRIGFYGAAQGQEAVPIATGLAVGSDDWVFPALREQSVMLVRGFPLRAFIAQVFGNAGDLLKGRQMPSHPSGRAVHQVSWSSCIGPQISQAVGAAWAMRARKARAVAIGFMGDGATSQADFHAAMNFAGVWKVPCVLVCQNNHWSISVPAERQTASRTFAVKARAYGIPALRVDGNDVLAISNALQVALERARAAGGPTFIEAVTYRMGPHSTSDDPSRYRAQTEVDEWALKDPLLRLRRHLAHLGLVSESSDAELEAELTAEISAAVDEVEAMPPPARESLLSDVYAELPWHLREELESLKKVGPPPTHV